ncbi:hypothetical protein ACVR0P_06580 [Streptococcus castoreus]|uniref:hypothetical protein n=1 Tax=Streptococcus castoreus TaxID=254786 RepID=UPI0004031F0F|nr:hypothetical protein [Streptococcus castoreus]
MGLLPARTAVLNYMSTVEKADVQQVMDALKSQYGTEKQFTVPLFLEHLMSLECNGYVEQVGYDLDEQQKLRIFYKIKSDGLDAVNKYIAAEYKR